MSVRLLPLLLLISGIFIPEFLQAQQNGNDQRLLFAIYVGDMTLEPGTKSYTIGQDSLTVDVFRCYISSLSLYKTGRKVWSESIGYHLLDVHEPPSLDLSRFLPGVAYDEIEFTAGIDSITNAMGVGSGDLDPVKGMYWAWQTGYINLKLEGRNPRCTTRNHLFQYHLGGFLDGNDCAQKVRLAAKNGQTIKIDLSKFLLQMDFVKLPTVMSPGANAKLLSSLIPGIFSVLNGSN